MQTTYHPDFSDEGKSPEHYRKLREESQEWRYPHLEWPPEKPIQRWGVYDNFHGLRCATIYAESEESAEHQYIMLFGKNPGYGFIISPETTHLSFTRMYYPPEIQEAINAYDYFSSMKTKHQVEYDTWYQPYEVNEDEN